MTWSFCVFMHMCNMHDHCNTKLEGWTQFTRAEVSHAAIMWLLWAAPLSQTVSGASAVTTAKTMITLHCYISHLRTLEPRWQETMACLAKTFVHVYFRLCLNSYQESQIQSFVNLVSCGPFMKLGWLCRRKRQIYHWNWCYLIREKGMWYPCLLKR